MSRSTPLSIHDYLAALRAALAGADPAVVQDALYDAEEYLRAEVAASPGIPEAEVLERVLKTYGRPEEIAAAYRDADVKAMRTLRPPIVRQPASPTPVQQFLSVYSDPRAYMSLFFMFLSLITGIFYFTLVITGLSLSAGLAIVFIGLPLFVAFIGLVRVIALGEGHLLEAVSGERMPRRPIHPGPSDGFGDRILAMLKDGKTWTTLLYLVLMLPLGIVYFVMATTGLSVSVALLLLPVAGILQRLEWWVPWGNERLVFSPAWLDTPVGWIFCGLFGVFILTSLLHVARLLIAFHARAAKALLVT
jgi:uncharacterized membrane protein